MAYFQKRKKIEQILYSWPVLAALLIVVIILFFSVWSIAEKAIETSRNKAIAEQQLKDITDKKNHLNQEITELKTDTGLERAIRNKYPVTKDGEGVVVIVDDNATADQNLKSTSDNSFWTWLKGIFSKK